MTETLSMPHPQLAAVAIEKAYRKDKHKVPVLRGIDVEVQKAEFLSIVGQSGSGKSTLMHLFGLLDSPDIGEIHLEGQRIDDLPDHARDQIRNRVFGFIFQFYHLLPELNLLENVLSPLMIRYSTWEYWKRKKQFRQDALEIIEKVGLSHRIKHRPSEMSGGEMQRAAIARALIAKPQILLADEPTGNLDHQTAEGIFDLIMKLNTELGTALVIVTHDRQLAARMDQQLTLIDGKLQN